MKSITITVLTTLFLLSGIQAQKQWKLNEKESTISFVMPDEDVEGSIKGLDAEVRLDLDDPTGAHIKASVDVSTLNTGVAERDDHLMSEDYFKESNYPEITYESNQIIKTESGFLAKGTLTMVDVETQVDMPFFYDEEQKAFIGRLKIHTGNYGVYSDPPTSEDAVDTYIRIVLPAQ